MACCKSCADDKPCDGAGIVVTQSKDTRRAIWGPISVEVPSRDKKLIRLAAIEKSMGQLVPPEFDHGFFTTNHDDALVVGRIDKLTKIDEAHLPDNEDVRVMVNEVVQAHGGLPTGFVEVTPSIMKVFPKLAGLQGEKVPFAGGTIRTDNRIGDKAWEGIQQGPLDAFSIAGVSFESQPLRWCDDTGCAILDEITDLDLSSVTIASGSGKTGPFGTATTQNPGAAFVMVQQAEPVDFEGMLGLIESLEEFTIELRDGRKFLVSPSLILDEATGHALFPQAEAGVEVKASSLGVVGLDVLVQACEDSGFVVKLADGRRVMMTVKSSDSVMVEESGGENRHSQKQASRSRDSSTMGETAEQVKQQEGTVEDLLPELMQRLEALEQRVAELAGMQSEGAAEDETPDEPEEEREAEEGGSPAEEIEGTAEQIKELADKVEDLAEDIPNQVAEAVKAALASNGAVKAQVKQSKAEEPEKPKRTKQAETPTPATQDHGEDAGEADKLELVRQAKRKGDPWALHEMVSAIENGVSE